MSDTGPLFERMLEELQVRLPSRAEAVRRLLRHYIQDLAQRRISPREGLKEIMELYDLAGMHEQSRTYAGDSHGIELLVGACSADDDLADRPSQVSFQGLYGREAVRALDEDVARLSNEWLERHGV